MVTTAVEQRYSGSTLPDLPDENDSRVIERRLRRVFDVQRSFQSRVGVGAREVFQPTGSAATDVSPDAELTRAYRAALREASSGVAARPTEFRVAGLESWTAVVVEVDEELVTAELRADRGSAEPVLADFERSQIGDLVEPGDVLYVTVRTVSRPSGLASRTSSVRLRRLGHWTEAEVQSHRARAEHFARSVESLID